MNLQAGVGIFKGTLNLLNLFEKCSRSIDIQSLNALSDGVTRPITLPGKLHVQTHDRHESAVVQHSCDGQANLPRCSFLHDLCGSRDGLQRQTSQNSRRLGSESSGRSQIMFRAWANARPSHLVDANLFDFARLVRDLDKFETKPDDIPKLR